MIKNVVLITTLFLLSLGDVFSQRLLNPIRSQSLVSAPILLIRSGSLSDLEINNISFPDTVSVGEIVTISAYLENGGDVLFDGNIKINLGFEMEEEVDLDDPESDEVIEDQQLTNVYLNPGESLFFTKDVIIDPQKVNPNNSNVVIVWPTFRAGLGNTSTADDPNYSLVSFYTMGILIGNLHDGGKTSDNINKSNFRLSSTYNQDAIQFNSVIEMMEYVSKSNIELEYGSIYNLEGKTLLNLNNKHFSLDQLSTIKKNQNTFFIVSMRVKNPVKSQHLYVKTNTM